MRAFFPFQWQGFYHFQQPAPLLPQGAINPLGIIPSWFLSGAEGPLFQAQSKKLKAQSKS